MLTREQLFDWGRKKSLSGSNLTSCHFLELTSFQSETSEDIEGVSILGDIVSDTKIAFSEIRNQENVVCPSVESFKNTMNIEKCY